MVCINILEFGPVGFHSIVAFPDPQKQLWIPKNLGAQVKYCFQQFF